MIVDRPAEIAYYMAYKSPWTLYAFTYTKATLANREKVRRKRVSAAIESLGSLAVAAKRLGGVPRSTVQQWKKGEVEPKLDGMALLADVTGHSLDYLAGRDESRGEFRAELDHYLRNTLPKSAKVSQVAVDALLESQDPLELVVGNLSREARIFSAALTEVAKRAIRKIEQGYEVGVRSGADAQFMFDAIEAAQANPTPAVRRKRATTMRSIARAEISRSVSQARGRAQVNAHLTSQDLPPLPEIERPTRAPRQTRGSATGIAMTSPESGDPQLRKGIEPPAEPRVPPRPRIR